MRIVTYSWLAVVLAVACAAVHWLGLAGWLAVAVLVASVAMHVAGNALGTRMREAADRELERRPTHAAGMPSHDADMPVAPPTRLERHDSLGSLVPISAGVGAVIGGAIGTGALAALTGSSLAGTILGGASSAVIGGFIGFLAASFVAIVRNALRDAIAAEQASRAVAERRP